MDVFFVFGCDRVYFNHPRPSLVRPGVGSLYNAGREPRTLRSRSDLWCSSAYGARVCVCVVCMRVFLL